MGIKVLIVDDDRLVRDSISIIIGMDENIDVIGTCANGQEALEFCKNNAADVILMDIRMPICDGVLGTKNIKQIIPNIKIIILTTFDDDEYVFQALKNGADGYILKNVSPDKIIESIKTVYGGNMIINPQVGIKLKEMLNKNDDINFEKLGLTSAEQKIVKLIADGFSNKEIAEKVFLTEGTVKNKITSILSKLNLRDRTQIAVYYLKKGKM